MRARASKDGMTVRVIAGTNNVLLAMDLNEDKRKGCLGFSIERTDIDTGDRRWLPNMLRFPSDPLDSSDLTPTTLKPAPNARALPARKTASARKSAKKGQPAEASAPSVSSARAPLQKFRWGDYTLDPGKRYRYRVIPRYGTAQKIIQEGKDSERRHNFDGIEGGTAVEIKTENNREPAAAVFFNRGAAASKAYNDRYGNNDPSTIPDALWWLSRGLEEALIAFIGRAPDSAFTIHAAIYEFQKPELLRALKSAKARGVTVNVVYHGRQKLKKGKPDPKDTTASKNNDAIKAVGIDFAKPRKADPQGAIMHNKFIVLLKKGEGDILQPMAVWTGSTNWTEGAIYGQLNVGHGTFDQKIAEAYEKYYQLLHADASAADMKKNTVLITPVPKNRDAIPHGVTPIFSPQSTLDMIDLYAELCKTAKVLMVSAPFALHPTILATFEKTPKDVTRFLMADKAGSFGKAGAIKLLENDPGNEVSVATTLNTALNDFQGDLLEGKESFHHAGVHIHSKIIAADPFGTDPVLVTGSANFSNNSTRINDSNSLIIRGDTAVMDVYVTEFMRMFEHYWFRAHMEGKTKGGKKMKTVEARVLGLKEDSSWMDPYFKAGTRESVERLAFVGAAN
jgi:phosphatidylserine/phosphatidylglycerophosphate/cardiolipin synthase-like enzyme